MVRDFKKGDVLVNAIFIKLPVIMVLIFKGKKFLQKYAG